MNEYTLLSIGDATYDTFITPSEAEALCDINNQECLICFSYGEKIPVSSIDYSVGGNAANNAVGSSRLGIAVAIMTSLGTDLVGETILHRLHTDRVDTSFIQKEPALASNSSTVITYSGERTIFTYHAPHAYQFPAHFPKSQWVYLTSMGDHYELFYKEVLEKVSQNNSKLAFNPGSRQLRGDKEILLATVAASELVYVNLEEARRIVTLVHPEGNQMGIKELLDELAKIGAKKIIITDGSNGSYAFDGTHHLKCGAMPIDAYERTGAGDAFGSGSLAALIHGKDMREALIWGSVNSTSVIGFTGAQRGLLREAEIYDWIDRAEGTGLVVSEI